MLQSQYDTLEPSGADEPLFVDIDQDIERVLELIEKQL